MPEAVAVFEAPVPMLTCHDEARDLVTFGKTGEPLSVWVFVKVKVSMAVWIIWLDANAANEFGETDPSKLSDGRGGKPQTGADFGITVHIAWPSIHGNVVSLSWLATIFCSILLPEQSLDR